MKPSATLQKLFLGGSDAASARAILRKQARLPLAKPPKGVRRVGVTTFLAGLRQNVPFSPKYRASPAGKARVRSQRALSLGRVCHRSEFFCFQNPKSMPTVPSRPVPGPPALGRDRALGSGSRHRRPPARPAPPNSGRGLCRARQGAHGKHGAGGMGALNHPRSL